MLMRILLARLHTVPPAARVDQIQDFVGVDCRAFVGVDYPAFDWGYRGPVTIEMGASKTVHGLWISGRGFLSDCAWVDC